jgi:hypothetical protein
MGGTGKVRRAKGDKAAPAVTRTCRACSDAVLVSSISKATKVCATCMRADRLVGG